MSLPPGFLDELRARVPLSEVVGRRVTWDARKSNPAKGDFWACCPFHEERTPSFHVDDRKGFYHCFGCHAKGDAIAFLREREAMGFMEAVEELARAAGLEMPRQDPAAAAKAEKGKGLAEVMEAAVGFFRTQLRGGRGRAALDYLRGRGLRDATLERFELGYAPGDRRALTGHLTGRGFAIDAVVEAGLAIRPEDGGAPFDRFRDRAMFPIRDARGRCIAFGGRAMSPEARAKYLNSPETPLFDKSRTLYNIGPARAAAAKARALIVVEGYMDVIALAEAGFEHAVAPLGTAVTEHHLRALWRVADEPVVALDGDAAGIAAALRAADLALPLLEAGKALRFALMPGKMDPDDLIRRQGPEAFAAAVAAAEPVVALLWRRETETQVFDSPERRAALDRRLKAILETIADRTVRAHYRDAFAERRAALFRPAGQGGEGARRGRGTGGGFTGGGFTGGGRTGGRSGGGRGRFAPDIPAMPRPETQASALARSGGEGRGREAAILLTLVNHPALAETHGDAVAAAEFLEPDLDALRGALLSALLDRPEAAADDDTGALRARLAAAAGRDAEALLRGAPHVGALRFARAEADAADAAEGLEELLARHAAEAAARAEAREAERDCAGEAAEPAVARLGAAMRAKHAAWPGRLPEERDEARPISDRLDELLASRRGRKGG